MAKKELKFGDPDSIKYAKKHRKRPFKAKVAKKDLERECAFNECKKKFTWRETKNNQHFCSLECANNFAALFGGGGRPSAWKPEYNQKMLDYFKVEAYKEVIDEVVYRDGEKEREKFKRVPNDLPLFEGFAASIGVRTATLINWAADDDESKLKYPGFFETYGICKAIQHRILVVGTLNGLYNSGFAQFLAKNITELKDKTEHEHSGPDGAPIAYKVML